MTRHPFERRCHVETEPRHHLSVLIPDHGELPKIVRQKQRDHKDDDVLVRTKALFYLLYIVLCHFVSLDGCFSERRFIYRTEILI